MKKSFIALALSWIFVGDAWANEPGSMSPNFYVGFQAGASYVDSNFRVQGRQKNPGEPDFLGTASKSVSDLGFVGELYAGFLTSYPKYNWGFEISFGKDTTKAKKQGIELVGDVPDPILPGVLAREAKLRDVTNILERPYFGTASVRFGRVIEEDLFIYLKFGIACGKFKYKFSQAEGLPNAVSFSDSKWRFGLLPGLGFESKLIKDLPLALRGEYTFHVYENFKTKDFVIPDNEITFSGKVQPRYHTFVLGLTLFI